MIEPTGEERMDNFEQVWRRIEDHAGEVFRQVRGGEFTYQVIGGQVVPDRTDYSFVKSQFEQALDRMPVTGPGELNDLRGPSYLFAILTDRRISG